LNKEKDTARRQLYNSPLLMANKYKKTYCPYCKELVDSKHFYHHLIRNHKTMKEIQELKATAAKSKEQALMLTLIRSTGNMEAAEHGVYLPKRWKFDKEVDVKNYINCVDCKTLILRSNVHQHRR